MTLFGHWQTWAWVLSVWLALGLGFTVGWLVRWLWDRQWTRGGHF